MNPQSISNLLLGCSVALLILSSSEIRGGIAQNKEILSPQEQEVLTRLEGMAWQPELTEEDRGFLRNLLAETLYDSPTLSRMAIIVAAVHEVEEAVPALRGQERRIDEPNIQKLVAQGWQGWQEPFRQAVAEAIREDRPVADVLVERLRSRAGPPPSAGDPMVDAVAIIEIKNLRAGVAAGSRLQGLPLSDRDLLLVDAAPLPADRAVEALLARFERTESLGEWWDILKALETYGDLYFSWLPELFRPSVMERLGGQKSRDLVGRTLLHNLPRIEPATRGRLKSVLALPLEKKVSEMQHMDDVKELRGKLLQAIEKREGPEEDS